MEEAAESGRFTSAASMVLAARLSTFEPEGISSVDLRVYDTMLEPVGVEGHERSQGSGNDAQRHLRLL